jgi:hypothetical protein
LNHKLFDRYKGPFTINWYSKGGNYKLKNVLNKELEGSFGVPKKKVGRPKKDEVKKKPIRKGQNTKRTTRSSAMSSVASSMFIIKALCIFIFLPLVFGIESSFQFCETIDKISKDTKIVDIHGSCGNQFLSNSAYPVQNFTKQQVVVLAKQVNKVHGYGFECWKWATKI